MVLFDCRLFIHQPASSMMNGGGSGVVECRVGSRQQHQRRGGKPIVPNLWGGRIAHVGRRSDWRRADKVVLTMRLGWRRGDHGDGGWSRDHIAIADNRNIFYLLKSEIQGAAGGITEIDESFEASARVDLGFVTGECFLENIKFLYIEALAQQREQ